MVAKADHSPGNRIRAEAGNHGQTSAAAVLAGLAMRDDTDHLPPDYKGEGSEVACMVAVRSFYKLRSRE